ncbi:DUF5914 domain-containing protein [Streptacidiphilus sp. N1-12]|uniref:DUF5914 domain-containing protein n=2 Tax=Streptacidiphilus alkalitolerans TaxID=3342712 RepID=A0ABV6V3Y7_9ACTN
MTGQPRRRTASARRTPLGLIGAGRWSEQAPTWQAARPAVIEAALKRALARPSGNWYVLAASHRVRHGTPLGRTVAGVEVVAWRDGDGALHAAPGACPHLGAPLARSPQIDDRLVCHWHGLCLGAEGFPGWQPYPTYDDGALAWVRLDSVGGEEPTPRPLIPARPDPDRSLPVVATAVGHCEPEDIIANRLDPWHGAWFHPYAFADLAVVESPAGAPPQADAAADRFVVEVAFRLRGRLGVPVRAAFTAPEPRTVVMHIIEGEGVTSVVETHATPMAPDDRGRPRTAVTELVAAYSGRPGFALARKAAPLLRPLVRRSAARLWRDDIAYAERRWQLRSTGRFPG